MTGTATRSSGALEDRYIELQDVHKRFGTVHAVRGVSLHVRRNEFVTLLGPSGCGKTTLLRLIGGLEKPDSGVITIGRESVEHQAPRNRHTRMVFQHYSLFPHMTVGQNVAFGLKMRNVPPAERWQRVRSILDVVGLAEKIDARPGQLSGGQQQRVAFARAIITQPTVLLLDEPLASLDQQLRKSMQLELKSLQRSLGITFIYVTHDQSEALTMSDWIAVMDNGQIEQMGTGEEIYERPATPFVARFIGEANVFEARVLDAGDDHAHVDLDGIHLVLPVAEGMRLTRGNMATFMVRPEKVEVKERDASACEGSLKGRLIDRIYLGTTLRLVIETATGRRLLADHRGQCCLTLGDEIVVCWDQGSVRWLH